MIYDSASNSLIHAIGNPPSPNYSYSTNHLPQQVHWKLVEKAMGQSGMMKPGEVFYISLPRSDLQVSVKGIPIQASLALGGWTAFKQMGSQTMVMGDLVLTENEVQLVMNQLFHQGIQVSALHNHLLGESTRIMYLHVKGYGDPVQLAKSIKSAMELTTIPWNNKLPNDSQVFSIDKQQLDKIFRHKGTVSGGVYHVSIPRLKKIIENGMEIPSAMGVATAINFQPTKNGKAAITGDFVLTAKEVNPVASTLRKHGIEVTALHNHMLSENPRLFFMHFWANDDAIKLAKALREAIDKTHSM
ncbi:peptidase M23 [Bacillus pseudomycoides]|nr:peptidase M23 [Bacillus pseudomycoides]